MSTEVISSAEQFKALSWIPDTVKVPLLNEYRYTSEQLNELKRSLNLAQNTDEKQRIVDKFFEKKEWIKKDATEEVTYLKEVLANLTIENLKKSLEEIEKEQDPRARWFQTNLMLGALEAKWYRIRLERDSVSLEWAGQDDKRLEFETVMRNYIERSKFNFENLKTAVLHRTTKLDDYISINSDTDKNPLIENMSAKNYYEFLLKKYKLDCLIVTKNEIKSNCKISPRDKDFMLAYKNDAYEDYPIGTSLVQYTIESKERRVCAKQAEAAIHTAVWKLPDETRTKVEAVIKKDDRGINERIGDFIKDPFAEILNISASAGPIWWLAIIWALIYFAFTEPKKVFGWIAIWWLAKWTGLADYLGNEFWSYTKPGVKAKVEAKKETKIELKTENLTESQKSATNMVIKDNSIVDLTKNFAEKNKKWKNWKIEEYLNFINSPEFQNKTAQTLFYTKDQTQNIFMNEGSLDPSIALPANLDPAIFKKVMRQYLTGQFRNDSGQPIPGVKEFKDFENRYLENGKNKDKTLNSTLERIYSK
ncbi:MAG: hypothetical protein ACD_2C00133G0002 [uncultured bacterium (gcode 4)]|uniref:Uncharacterized protein n=1 Tax=uncultured bacterium (gcode 4) TaxID=1234023 RepID=K2FEL3_9BACT|nr:MAG: hypothetical protein ACD_2C00133G0002 [uncultured bacterium (gcode 4)]